MLDCKLFLSNMSGSTWQMFSLKWYFFLTSECFLWGSSSELLSEELQGLLVVVCDICVEDGCGGGLGIGQGKGEGKFFMRGRWFWNRRGVGLSWGDYFCSGHVLFFLILWRNRSCNSSWFTFGGKLTAGGGRSVYWHLWCSSCSVSFPF